MEELKQLEILKIISTNSSLNGINIKNIHDELEKYLESKTIKKAVLGLDIYHYSQYHFVEQSLIPLIFNTIYYQTINECLGLESFIFQNYQEETFLSDFIDLGDGGFQIFNNPLDAIIFSIFFQANIRAYNSNQFSSLRNLIKITGEITLRYALTYDLIYNYEKNHYGPAIINNSRILSKDKLNRFLFDENVLNWFYETFFGIENIQTLAYPEDFKKIGLIFHLSPHEINDIITTHVQKIGIIKSKDSKLSCYSLHLQVYLYKEDINTFSKFIITLGNLNSNELLEDN